MSSYLLSSKDLAALARPIYNAVHYGRLCGSPLWISAEDKHAIESACYHVNKALEVPHLYSLDEFNVFRVLNRLNADALNARYGDEEPVESNLYEMPAIFPTVSRIQFYKLLQSFLYQCAEGDIPKRPLFLALESLKYAAASKIIESLPEYESARWA